jgi:predicted lipoprotein with Yx(FWY)xxD motif
MNKRNFSVSRSMIVPVVLIGLGLGACGSNAPVNQEAVPPPAAATTVVATAPAATEPAPDPAPPAAGGSVAVKAGSSAYGQILVDASGNTLYAFTNDSEAKPTCIDACAEAWPPVIVDASWTVAPGLDAGVFSTITHPAGGEQLTAGAYPLYRFSGDARPGDANGQASGGVWFVVGDDATPITDEAVAAGDDLELYPSEDAPPSDSAPAPEAEEAAGVVTIAETDLGSILAGPDGLTVYGFTEDADGTPTCVDGCAVAWPPLVVEPNIDLTGMPGEAEYTIVERADGTAQMKAGKWPLYYFAGDEAPGETNGQGSGGSWFVVADDGSLIK